MTLDDAANYVCRKVRRQDTDSIDRCKEFLQRRADMVWNDQLWKFSLCEVFVSYDPDNETVFATADGTLWLPEMAEKPIAIREANWDYNGAPQARLNGALVPIQWEDAFASEYEWLGKEGLASKFVILPPTVWAAHPNTSALNAVGAFGTLNVTAANFSADSGVDVSIGYIDANGKQVNYSGTLLGSTFLGGQITIAELIYFGKPSSTSAWTLTFRNGSTVDTDRTLTFTTAAGEAPRRQRIKLIQRPDRASYYRILTKMRFMGWPEYVSCPMVPALNCLMAFAQGDMLQHMFQYGMAKECYAEGEALLEQLKRIETVQQAHHQRIIPSNGIGSPDEYNVTDKFGY